MGRKWGGCVRRRKKIRQIVFITASILLLGGFWLEARLSQKATQRDLEYTYRRALGDMTDYVGGMEETLEKALFTGNGQTRNEVTAKLLEQSSGAKSAMAALPFSQEKTERISRFLSQVGDYALAMNREGTTESGNPSTMENISNLREYAKKLAAALTGIQARLTAEGANISKTERLLNQAEAIEEIPTLDDDVDQVAQEFSQFPTLLYDGPFSDHVTRRTPAALEALEGVTQDKAREKAAQILDAVLEEVEYVGEGGSQLPVYQFRWGSSMVAISKQGGELVYYKRAGQIENQKIGYQAALEAARSYISQWGFPELRESYYVITDNLCAINFHSAYKAPDGREVICYPDLVKVTIEMEEGGMMELDASGYWMNHQTRSVPALDVSREAGAEALNPRLAVEAASLAIIPTPGFEEILCWEYRCTAPDGRELLSYVNASTGLEERLFLIQRDEKGVLVN